MEGGRIGARVMSKTKTKALAEIILSDKPRQMTIKREKAKLKLLKEETSIIKQSGGVSGLTGASHSPCPPFQTAVS